MFVDILLIACIFPLPCWAWKNATQRVLFVKSLLKLGVLRALVVSSLCILKVVFA